MYLSYVIASPDINRDIESLAMSLAEGDVTGIICDVASIAIPGISGLKSVRMLDTADEIAAVGKTAKVIQIFDVADDAADDVTKRVMDLLAAQNHHAVPNPPMKFMIMKMPDIAATGISRNNWIFHAMNLNSHLGYDKVHRELTNEIYARLIQTESYMKTGQFTYNDLTKILTEVYEDPKFQERFGYLIFK